MEVEGNSNGIDTGRSGKEQSLRSGHTERAILVGVDFTVRSRIQRAGVEAARAAARLQTTPSQPDTETPSAEPLRSAPAPHGAPLTTFDADESLAEFRELVTSAGAEVAAEVMQRRGRPDPATLIGAGKVEEIAGIAGSTQAPTWSSSTTICPPPSCATSRAPCPAGSSTAPSLSSTSLPATPAPAKASFRWNWLNWSTCFPA